MGSDKQWAWRAGMAAYRGAAGLFFRAGGLSWLKRKYRGEGLPERMGNPPADLPKGGIWVHAVSVGEVQSASALIMRMRGEGGWDGPIILSTVTATGRDMARKLVGERADRIIYGPWDAPRFVGRALDAVAPAAYVAMETELWPEMLSQLRARGIPAFLANGRISDRSFARLRRQASFWRGVLSCLTRVMARYDEDRERFEALGVPREKITLTGDCKIDALMERRGEEPTAAWPLLRRDGIGPLLVAGSTHWGEEEIVLKAFRHTCLAHLGARLLVVPRHPDRAPEVVAVARNLGLRAYPLSDLRGAWDVAAVDRIGVLFEIYAAADAAFVGGSLVPKGGQNPFEPVLCGVPAIHGPCMTDFPDTGRMDRMGAGRLVHNAAELIQAWDDALDPAKREAARQACADYCATLGGAADRTWNAIKKCLESA